MFSELPHKWEVGTASVKIYLCLLESTSYQTKNITRPENMHIVVFW